MEKSWVVKNFFKELKEMGYMNELQLDNYISFIELGKGERERGREGKRKG